MDASWPTVRAMTWNIHGAVGRNPRFNLVRVVGLIRGHDPDILALQEIDSRRPGSGDVFGDLQQELGRHGIGAKSIATADGDYGQMLVSRWPIEEAKVHDISFPECEPRRAIAAVVKTPHGRLRVIATHLGLSLRERNSQLHTLLELIREGDRVTVVLGDFNDWIWAGSVRGMLRHVLPGRTRHRTFPAIFPLFRLDRIYCRPGRALISSFTDPRARELSDHLPVVADLIVGAVENSNIELAAATVAAGGTDA